MKTPTAKQIKANIDWLEKNIVQLPTANAFGENIQEHARAALTVLKEGLDEDAIYNRSHSEDESEEEAEDDSKDWSNGEKEAALFARHWLDGEEESAPKDNYKGLVGRKFTPMRPPGI